MRPAHVSLLGTTLCFDRSGNRLAIVDREAVSIVDLASSRTRRLAHADARAVAAFDDQIWIATSGDELARFDDAGRPIGATIALPFAETPALQPAPCGPPAAAWASTPALVALDDLGQLVVTEVDADVVIPLTGRRHVVVRGARATTPTGLVAQLAPGATVLGGAVLRDGKSAVLLVAHGGGRQLVTLALGAGRVVATCSIATGAVRVAIGRAIAAIQLAPHALRVIDLRGRELGTIEVPHDVGDFAIDPDGRRLVLRDDDRVDVHELAELLGATPTMTATTAAATSEVAATADQIAQHRVRATPERAGDEPMRGEATITHAPLVALGARPRPIACDRAVALAQLDRELRGVALWTLGAIASAWDSRRLGYGDEGRHPFELEVAAILGENRGHAIDYVVAARDRLVEHERAIAADPRWRADDTPIGALIAEFGLSPRAVDVLLAVAAPALWGEVARLYGILANDIGRIAVDELAVQQVLAARHDRHDVAAELDPRAPLVRLGLVHVSDRRPRPFGELAVDPVVIDRLRAHPPQLGDATRVRAGDRALAELDIPRAVLVAATTALAHDAIARERSIASAGGAGSRPAREPARIVVRGRVGSGRKALLAALAAAAGRDLGVIDARALPHGSERFVAELRRSLRRAQLGGLVPCVAHLDDVTFEDRPARDVAAETLRAHPGAIALVLAPDAPTPLAPGHIAIDLPPLAESERASVWRRALAEAELGSAEIDVDAVAARYRIGPGAIRRAIACARDQVARAGAIASGAGGAGAREDGGGTPAARVDAYIRQTRDARLAQYARRVDRLASWSSVVLPPDVLDSLRELVGRVRYGRTVFETWGMNRTMATSRGLTALFQGSPGTGKTLVAGVIARELGLDLYQVDLSKVMSKWIGETERNLSQIFDAAEDGQVVLLFDEADSLFAKRTEVRSSNDRYANLEVNYLLQRLDAFEGIAILTTNSSGSIDQAFKRRLSFRLSFPFPDEETRAELWRAHLPPELPIAGALALDALARKYQLSGGYIRNACLRAAFLAAQEESALHQHHLERAVALEFAELGKLSTGGTID
jgi:hypothetical protein